MRTLLLALALVSLAACDSAGDTLPLGTGTVYVGTYAGSEARVTIDGPADADGDMGSAVLQGQSYDLGGGFGADDFAFVLTPSTGAGPAYSYRGDFQTGALVGTLRPEGSTSGAALRLERL